MTAPVPFFPWSLKAIGLGAAVLLGATAGLNVGQEAQARDQFSFSSHFSSDGYSSFGIGYRSGGRDHYRGHRHWQSRGWDRGHRGWGYGGPHRDHFALSFSFVTPPTYYSPRAYSTPARPYYGGTAYYPAGGIVVFSPYMRDRLSIQNRRVYFDAYRSALAAPIGEPINWRDGRIAGEVTTTRDGWAGDRYCREFLQSIVIGGQTEQAYGTACRNSADTDWEIVPN